EEAEGGVAGAGQGAGGLHDGAEDDGEVEFRLDGEEGIQEVAQSLGIVDVAERHAESLSSARLGFLRRAEVRAGARATTRRWPPPCAGGDERGRRSRTGLDEPARRRRLRRPPARPGAG